MHSRRSPARRSSLTATPSTLPARESGFAGSTHLRCDILAAGVIAAVQELGVRVPIVIRMEGTNVEEGKKMLQESGLNFTTANSMGEAAERVVALTTRD